jgi:hypothetical protein
VEPEAVGFERRSFQRSEVVMAYWRGDSDLSQRGLLPFGLALLVAILSIICVSTAAADDAPQKVSIPGTDYKVVVGESQLDISGVPKRSLAGAVADWLAREFDLPPAAELPAVELVPSRAMAGLRYGALGGEELSSLLARSAQADVGKDIVALYDDRARTIYFSNDWTGAAPGEISTLVHEMVHHLQNLAGASYACPAEREKLAYKAQARFLGLFGQSLESAFSVDPMALLVRTTCAM